MSRQTSIERPQGSRRKRAAIPVTLEEVQAANVTFGIRRILAERPDGGSQGQGQYLIDWLPSWEDKIYIPKEAELVEEWEENKEHTFTFGKHVVYRCSNPTEDNYDVAARTMCDNVLGEFKKWMIRNADTVAKDLFDDRDWEFETGKDRRIASRIARIRDEPPKPTAAEVMRRSYIEMRAQKVQSFRSRDLAYATVKVQYLGSIDDLVDRRKADGTIPATTTKLFLEPLFRVNFYTMDPEDWETNEALHDNLKPLSDMAGQFQYMSPFMLKHQWPLMFTRLFYLADDIVKNIKGHKLRTGRGWSDRSRDLFLYTYQAKCRDQRPIDCIERTYLACRDLSQWHVQFRSIEDDCEGEQIILEPVQQESEDVDMEKGGD